MFQKLQTAYTMLRSFLQNKDSHASIEAFLDTTMPPILLESLRTDMLTCHACPLHVNGCSTSAGDPCSPLVLVGEASGEEEAKSTIPFVGPAGQMLDRILKAAAEHLSPLWARDSVYLTNVVHCRPKDKETNRPPTQVELAACRKFLDAELSLLKPKLILCLGSTAAKSLISPDFKISEDHGKFFQLPNGTYLSAIYHPAYILHMGEDSPEGIKVMGEVWEDVTRINAKLQELVAAKP